MPPKREANFQIIANLQSFCKRCKIAPMVWGKELKIKIGSSLLPGQRVEPRHTFTVRKGDFDGTVLSMMSVIPEDPSLILVHPLSLFLIPTLPSGDRHTQPVKGLFSSLLQTCLRRPDILQKQIHTKWWHQRPTASTFLELSPSSQQCFEEGQIKLVSWCVFNVSRLCLDFLKAL